MLKKQWTNLNLLSVIWVKYIIIEKIGKIDFVLHQAARGQF